MIKILLTMIPLLSATCWAQIPGATLQEASDKMNKSLPEIFDPVTKLVTTSVVNKNIKYHFILQASSSEFSWAMPKVKNKVLETVCSQMRERFLLTHYKANIVYSYENLNGQFLGEFMIKSEHCRKK